MSMYNILFSLISNIEVLSRFFYIQVLARTCFEITLLALCYFRKDPVAFALRYVLKSPASWYAHEDHYPFHTNDWRIPEDEEKHL